MVDCITVGSATIDAFLTIHHANIHCRLNEKDCELCVKYGEKIQLDACEFLLGGNACNVAVGLRRVGFTTAVVVEIGDDEFGKKIKRTLIEDDVDTSFVTVGHAPSSFAVAINFKGERTLFVEHILRKHDFSYFSFGSTKSKWMYLTSLGNEWKHAYNNALSFVKEHDIRLAFNPGTVQIAEDGDTLTPFLKQTEVLFLNREEAMKMVTSNKQQAISNKEKEYEENMGKLLTALQKMGAKTVVITDGEKGSFALNTDGNMYACPILDAPVVEKTGAGDAFASGFLAGILAGCDVPTCMQWGTVNAASVIGKVGAQPGLLSREEIEKRVVSVKLSVNKIFL